MPKRNTAATDKFIRFLPTGAGLVLLVVGLRSTLQMMGQPLGPHDEGILLTNANLVSQGQVPYRDFYSNYPPGIYLAIVGLWKIFGVSVTAERALGFAAHGVLSLSAGWLAAYLAGSAFSFLAAGMVLFWLAWLGTVAFAWLVALAAALVACVLLLRALEHGSRSRWMAAGLALGAVGCIRHDLLIYFTSSLVAVAAAWRVGTRQWKLSRPEWIAVGCLVFGAAVPLLAVWTPTLARAGVGQAVEDVYSVLVRDVMPARALPLPPVLELRPTIPPPLIMPVFLIHSFEGAIAVTLIGPAVALLWLLWAPRMGLRSRAGPALLLALSVAVLPQMLGRTDAIHALYTVTPCLILLTALAEWLTRGRGLWGAAVAVAIAGIIYSPARTFIRFPDPGPPAAWQEAYPRYSRLPEIEPAREAVLEFVAANTDPRDPIFVGLSDHRRVYVGEMDLYYLADRPGATRVMQFDPNMVNREDVQRQMAAEIEAHGTKVAILSSRFTDFSEPNESSTVGSSFLDDFLQAQFETVGVVGPYQLLKRRDPTPARSARSGP